MSERLTDVEYEEKLKQFQDICAILEVPVCAGRIKCETFKMPEYPQKLDDILAMERDKVLKPLQVVEQPMRSWTRNMYNTLASTFCSVNNTDATTFGDGHINKKSTGGVLSGSTSTACSISGLRYFIETTYGDDSTQGIWVGTGTTGETMNDFDIETQISHGDAAGELRYWNMLYTLQSWAAGTRKWTNVIRRHFTNHSGGNVVVGEVCLLAPGPYLAARDALSASVTVGDLTLFRASFTIESDAYPS